jgi:hypothetical protein
MADSVGALPTLESLSMLPHAPSARASEQAAAVLRRKMDGVDIAAILG